MSLTIVCHSCGYIIINRMASSDVGKNTASRDPTIMRPSIYKDEVAINAPH